MERNMWRLGARDRISGNVHCIAIMAGHQTLLRKKVRTALVERGYIYSKGRKVRAGEWNDIIAFLSDLEKWVVMSSAYTSSVSQYYISELSLPYFRAQNPFCDLIVATNVCVVQAIR